MCPVCIASTATMVAGAGSTGGILAVCFGTLKRFFRAHRAAAVRCARQKESESSQSIPKMKGEVRWQ